MTFKNDCRHMVAALNNQRPERLPIYEHIISPAIMEQVLDVNFADFIAGDAADKRAFFRHYCHFFKEMTYDTVSFEVTVVDTLPGDGAIMGGMGPIQNRADFEAYPWHDLPRIYWEIAGPQFDAFQQCIPPGMSGLGGIGNGIFEISEDLVGFEYLAYLQIDDPRLFAELYQRIGNLLTTLWAEFLQRYGDDFAICRFGDDLGFKTSTLVSPATIRDHILPQYQRVISLIKAAKKPFLWHSCGNIFSIMDDVIALGIDAKHSNEDVIAPFDTWIARYGDRIGVLGGVDVDLLCQQQPADIVDAVVEAGTRFRKSAQGYALGSGNSIPDYVPVEGYLAMIEGAKKIRAAELTG